MHTTHTYWSLCLHQSHWQLDKLYILSAAILHLSVCVCFLIMHFFKCALQLSVHKILEKSAFNICIRFTYMGTMPILSRMRISG